VDCAYRLFCAHGYPATTVETIAAAAGVAVQTVYYVFRTKAQLLREVIEVTAAGGHDPDPVMQRAWMQQAIDSPDGRRALALVVEHGVDIYARMAPLGDTVRAAAAIDPDIDSMWQAIAQARRTAMRQLVANMASHGQLRPGLTPEHAADILFVVNSHEVFLGLTRDSNWTIPDFKAWLYATLCQQLFPEPPPQS
jgi:AcrR family transcriptional regulator